MGYEWIAKMKDGNSVITQLENGKEHLFGEVEQAEKDGKLKTFELDSVDEGKNYEINLENGTFKEGETIINNEFAGKKCKLIYMRRNKVMVSNNLTPMSKQVIYRMGLQDLDTKKKVILEIHPQIITGDKKYMFVHE